MQRATYGATFWLALMPLCGDCSDVASGKSDLLETVRAGHLSARGSIRSLACEFIIIDVPKTSFGDQKAAYWQVGDLIRYQEQWATDKQDTLVEPGIFKRVRTPLAKVSKMIQDPSGEIRAHSIRLNPDPWHLALFRFWAYPKAWTFEELLLAPHKLRSVQRKGDLIEVSLSALVPDLKGGQERRDFELTFDPKVNYLVRERAQRNGDYAVVATVSRFVEVQPGIFFPESVKTEHRHKSQVTRSSTVTFRNVSINEPLPADIFQFRFPAGTIVLDAIKRELRKADDNGEPTLPPINSQGQLIELVDGAPLMSQAPAQAGRASESEPHGWTCWLLPVSLILLILAAILWRVQKGRNARTMGA